MQREKLLTILLLIALAGGGAYLLSGIGTRTALAVAVCVCGVVVALLRTEMSIYFLIVAMLLSPQFEVGSAIATRAKAVTLRLDDFLIAIITLTWFLKQAFYKNLNFIRSTPINGSIWLYSLSCILSTLVGISAGDVEPRAGALFVVKYIEYFMIFWMVINTTYSEQQIRRYLALMLAVAMIVSVVAILQIPSGHRVTAPFEGEKGEPNTLGGYLLLSLSMVLCVVLSTKQYRKILLTLAAGMLIPFLFTLSRSSYLGFLPVVLLIPLLLRRKILTIWIVAAILIVIAFPRVLPKPVVDRIDFTFHQHQQKAQVVLMGKRLDTATSARYQAFSEALDAFWDKPLIGYGVTGWGFIDSMYFRTLVETGLVGLACFLFMAFRILQMAWKTRRYFLDRNPFYLGLSSGFIAGTFGLLVHAVGSNTFIIVRIMEPYWMLCAILFVLPEIDQQSDLVAPDLVSAA